MTLRERRRGDEEHPATAAVRGGARRRGREFALGLLFQADVGGNLVITYSPADSILELPDRSGDDGQRYVLNEAKKEPGPNASVRVILTPRKKAP